MKLYLVNSTSTREVIAALDKYFGYFGRPRRIISDRGTCFTSLEFGDFLVRHNITQVKVATASPQANGQVERVNRVIKAMLGKLTNPINHADWSHKLSQVEYAINNSIHRTTKRTPSELLFGVNQRGQIVDELTEYLDDKFQSERDLASIRSEASKSIENSQRYAADRALARNRPAKEYNVGDYVVVRHIDITAGTNKKFIPKYRGPYVVHKKLGHDRYVIRDVESCQLTQLPYDGIVEANRIKSWLSPSEAQEVNCETTGGDTESNGNESDISDEETMSEFEGFDEDELKTAIDRGQSMVRSAEL